MTLFDAKLIFNANPDKALLSLDGGTLAPDGHAGTTDRAPVEGRSRRHLWLAPSRPAGWRGKRSLDLVVALALILLAIPVLAMIALAVKLTSPGPVLFRQRRVGRGGQDFFILKFRSMHADAEQRLRSDPELLARYVRGGHKIARRLDPRITPVGRVLRRWSLDELPQLFNVVAGKMSLVGPRPVRDSELESYAGKEFAYFSMRPGLTGLWQVSGRSTVQFPARADFDGRYFTYCGPWLDVRILLRTPVVMATGRGAE